MQGSVKTFAEIKFLFEKKLSEETKQKISASVKRTNREKKREINYCKKQKKILSQRPLALGIKASSWKQAKQTKANELLAKSHPKNKRLGNERINIIAKSRYKPSGNGITQSLQVLYLNGHISRKVPSAISTKWDKKSTNL